MSDLNISALLGSPQSKRWAQASKVKNLEDVTIPYPLEVWNYQACDRHDKPTPDCRWHKCGGHPFKHQNKTASFSYIARRSLVGNSTGTGKQQPVTEPVLTPSGWTTMGQLRPGDLVVGQNGRPTEVLSVHPQTELRTYKVTFSDGSWTLAGPDHLWTAGTKSMLHQGYPMKVVTTMDMANSLHRQWSIPMTEPVEFDPQDTLPCDPYLLGIVLGDGHINKYGASTICTDLEIISNLGLPLVRPHETSPYTGYANVPHSLLGDALPPLSRSWEKSIPVSFMRGSSKDRLALLQGLLDSDGSPMRTGGVEFSSTSYELAEQVVELTQSLGGVASRGKPRRTWYTHNGEKRQGKESYRINVKLPPQFIPFRLTRKLAKFVPPTKYLPKRVVRSIERVEDQESVCIRVSAEDSLYLTRNYIVTHNTLSALLTLALAHHYGERIKAIVVVPTISVKQWHAETERWTPGFKSVSIPSKTPKKDRLLTYASKWDVLIMGNHAFTRDVQHINQIDINQVIVDDIDPALSVNNQTWQALSIICNNADLVIDMNATSLQMRLEQLYAASCLIGGQDVWGSVKNFNRNYIRKEKVWITTKIKKNGKEEIGKKPVFQTTGYKNLAQPLDSKILTPSGWRNIGSLELGDEIIDSQGKVQTVEYINDRGVQDVWEVKLRDGSTARAAGDHLWTVRNIYGNYVDLLTTELTTKYARPVSIDMPRGQMKGTQEPLVDPYFMGYMLGDGHLAHGLSFTCHKDEVDIIDQFDLPEDVTIKVATQFENYAAYRVNTPKGIQPQECSECGDTSKSLMRGMCRTCYSRLWYRGEHINKPSLLRNSLLTALEESGIQGRVGVTKVLPNNWNSWSFGNRLALLQGLLDSDGSATLERRRVTHVSISPGLADGVRDLARSVGLVSYQTKIHRESSRDVIHTHILWDGKVRLFRGVKKWDTLTQAPPMNTQRTPRSVVSVTRVEDSPVRCIGVSSPDSLYITDNYLLTHNSHFKKKFDPMSIRITYEDIADDVTIPALVTEQVYLDMTKKQRDRYTELQGGVRTILGDNNMPDAQKAINALTAFTIGSQICAGTFALKTTSQSYEPDGPEASPKLDWIMDKLTDDWTDEKVVVYAKFRGSIIALQKRLENEGIGFSTIWGVETDADVRNDEMTRFWEDPNTKVMIISVSGERSLNLQNASILVMWDLQLNPARVAQIAGRVRRVGSSHKRVFVFELLMSDTQEERYMAALAARQTLFDFVYDVDTEGEDADNLLIQKLDTEQILRLIQP